MDSIGGRKCVCSHKTSQLVARNLTQLCLKFCNRFNIQLNGCSPCKNVTGHGSNESLGNDHQPDGLETEQPSPIPPTTDAADASAPNWNEVCSSLCKNGEGGVLCNCDLSPLHVQ